MSTVASTRDEVVVTARELRKGDRDGSLMVGRQVVSTRPLDGGRVEVVLQWGRTGRKEIARPDADRTFRVRRKVTGSGQPLRYRGEARSTGGLVEVWDTSHPDSPVQPEQVKGHRWALRCSHGTAVGRQTLELARDDVADPRLWCLSCVETMPGALPLPLVTL